ncbi:cytochrome o ubiquinol oxidase subunit III [Caballeronia terrestris]|uniref:Cytochrome o ubiquinol oxidase subunit III n=1 Tax=Caballeronia terrestris TaxID=1226301 RepID=A0A158HFJ8_9BURK|nr:cytochrome o ubiquinol oxidase subunit III [Caballeronia terrestris]
MLLLSSITFGCAMLGWLAVTFLLGLGFLWLEFREFGHLLNEGFGPNRSAFLSSFFTLVGTHGLHVAMGLVWMAVLAAQIICNPAMSECEIRRLTCLSLFWHFLDIVWIGVFTFVYLASVI